MGLAHVSLAQYSQWKPWADHCEYFYLQIHMYYCFECIILQYVV